MTDRFTVHAVVIGLVLVSLAVLGALAFALSAVSLSPEQRGNILGVIGSMGTLSLGAVAGILARTTSQAAVVDQAQADAVAAQVVVPPAPPVVVAP